MADQGGLAAGLVPRPGEKPGAGAAQVTEHLAPPGRVEIGCRVHARHLSEHGLIRFFVFSVDQAALLGPDVDHGQVALSSHPSRALATFSGSPSCGLTTTSSLPSTLVTPIEAANEHYGPPEWWEVDYYVGIIGFGFLAVFGIFGWLGQSNNQDQRLVHFLAPALIVMTFLSLDIIFRAIANLPIPFIGAERVSSRFFVLPFLFLIVFGVMALQRWLDSQRLGNGIRLLLVAGLVAIALDLWQHSRVWRPSAAQLGFEVYSPNMLVFIENRPDPAYQNALVAGVSITLIALAYSVWRLLRAPKGTPTSTEVADQEYASGSQGAEK